LDFFFAFLTVLVFFGFGEASPNRSRRQNKDEMFRWNYSLKSLLPSTSSPFFSVDEGVSVVGARVSGLVTSLEPSTSSSVTAVGSSAVVVAVVVVVVVALVDFFFFFPLPDLDLVDFPVANLLAVLGTSPKMSSVLPNKSSSMTVDFFFLSVDFVFFGFFLASVGNNSSSSSSSVG